MADKERDYQTNGDRLVNQFKVDVKAKNFTGKRDRLEAASQELRAVTTPAECQSTSVVPLERGYMVSRIQTNLKSRSGERTKHASLDAGCHRHMPRPYSTALSR